MPERPRLLHGRPAIVLLAEDNENDIELTRIGFEQSGFAVDLHVVRDGEACVQFLRKQDAYANADTPDLVLLDLQMPKMNGMEVLKALSSEDALRHIPVIVLTTSSSEREVTEAYRQHCRGYLIKPIGFGEFVRAVRALGEYWFNLVALPKG
ncbi:MAG: response regulator [Xanthomonadaceae bacterium]|nr:response regulator [Xanthomonadaceae bacterium]